MRTYIILFALLARSYATKEVSEKLAQLLNDPDVLQEIVKRLEGGSQNSPVRTDHHKHSFSSTRFESKKNVGHSEHISDTYDSGKLSENYPDDQTCKKKVYRNTIIKTNASLAAGAKFIWPRADSLVENTGSVQGCTQKCCDIIDCDLAVYENETKHSCYLFQCINQRTRENYCKFDPHPSYVSITVVANRQRHPFPQSVTSYPPQKDKFENDLTANVDKTKAEPKKVRPTPRPVEEPVTTQEPKDIPHSVSLDGACNSENSCEDPNAVCLHDWCQCQQGYYRKQSICREVCGSGRFECIRRGTSQKGHDCVSKSLVCDGTDHCADGSDERNCPAKDYKPGNQVPPKRPQDGNTRPELNHNRLNPVKTDPDIKKVPPTYDGGSSEKNDVSSHSNEETDSLSKPDLQTHKKPNEDKETSDVQDIKDNSLQASSEKDAKADSKEVDKKGKISEEKKKDHSLRKETGTEKPADKHINAEDKHLGNEKKNSSKEKKTDLNVMHQKESILVTKEHVIVASATDGAEGPIVALALGLAVTLMLLVFVGCRLRNVRKRLRKHRPLHSNEADYLINGMYL